MIKLKLSKPKIKENKCPRCGKLKSICDPLCIICMDTHIPQKRLIEFNVESDKKIII